MSRVSTAAQPLGYMVGYLGARCTGVAEQQRDRTWTVVHLGEIVAEQLTTEQAADHLRALPAPTHEGSRP